MTNHPLDFEADLRRQRALDALNIVDTPPEQRFDRVTRLAQQLFGVETVTIAFIDRDRQWFKSKVGAEHFEGPRSTAFCDVTIRTPETLVVEDASVDYRFSDNPLVLAQSGIRFYAGHPLEAPGGERVGTLCLFDPKPRVFADADRVLLRDLALWVQNELSIADEQQRASEVQRGLLPKNTVSLTGYELAGACAPASSIGGDFYDWYPTDGGVTFTLADVMGKGMGAAIIAATVRAVLRSGRQFGISTAVQMAATALEDDLESTGSFVTMLHGHLDGASGDVHYIDAGHGLSLVVRADGTTQRLSSDGLPLGIDADSSWAIQCIRLEPGDILVSLSDGVLDIFDGSLASLDEVEAIVRRSPSSQAIVDTLVALATGQQVGDDFTVLAVRRFERT